MARAKSKSKSAVERLRKDAKARTKRVSTQFNKVVKRTEKLRSQVESRAEESADQTRRRAAKLAGNVIDFQKTTFDNTFKVVDKLQSQSEDAIAKLLTEGDWMPREGKSVVKEWAKLLKSARKDFQKTVDTSFDLISDLLERLEKESAKKKPVAKKKPAKKKAAAKKKPAKKKAAAKKRTAAKKKAAQ